MDTLIADIRNCRTCEPYLEAGCNPVMAAAPDSRIVIIGQAPGRRVHKSGIAWDDKSGDNLRYWLGVGKEAFYDSSAFAIIPMGFCFPGSGKSGDLPPRKECAPLWHPPLWVYMSNVRLILLVGQYAQRYYLEGRKQNLTETVRHYEAYLPAYFPLPHPSPRNNIWQKKNPWFKDELLPELRKRIQNALG